MAASLRGDAVLFGKVLEHQLGLSLHDQNEPDFSRRLLRKGNESSCIASVQEGHGAVPRSRSGRAR